MILDNDAIDTLKKLGLRLRRIRLQRGDTQEAAATRLGVTVPTIRALEKGAPTVSLGLFATALSTASRLHELDQVAVEPILSFDDIGAQKRQRGSRTRRVRA